MNILLIFGIWLVGFLLFLFIVGYTEEKKLSEDDAGPIVLFGIIWPIGFLILGGILITQYGQSLGNKSRVKKKLRIAEQKLRLAEQEKKTKELEVYVEELNQELVGIKK